MGHCDSPAQLHGDGEFFGFGERTIAIDSERAGRGCGTAPVKARIAEPVSENRAAESSPATSGQVSSEISRGASWSSSAASGALLAIFRAYQIFLSPFLGGACKFYPSCSNYAYQAVARHGARRGLVLALKRLGRCRPFTKGGVDLVPETDEILASPRERSALCLVPSDGGPIRAASSQKELRQ
jgi:uncharacterized protein